MTQESLFDQLDVLADAPESLAKTRALILEWAVRGRLVAQDNSEEPASQLLERVACTSRIGKRRIDEQEVISRPFELPANWEWVTLPRVLNKLTDGTHHSPPNGSSGDFMYVTAKNIKSDGILLDDITYVSRDIHDEIYSRCDPVLGDILYIKDGATTGIATINDLAIPFSMLSSVALLKPSEAIFNRYLLWAMRSPFFYAETRDCMKGAAITRVTLSVMSASLIPLPPLAEQRRIVAKVDELMALCDRLERQHKDRDERKVGLARASMARFAQAPTPANLNLLFHKFYAVAPADLRKSILSLAVEGKLVPGSERSVDSLESILAGASANGVSKGPTLDAAATEILRISAGTSRADFYVDEDDFKHVELFPNEIERFRLLPGDLLACRFNGNLHYVGRFSYYRGESMRVQVNPDKLIRFRINTNLHSPRYVCFAMNAPQTREVIEAMCATTAGNIGLSAGRLKGVRIPLPPLAEQRKIVAKVDSLMALVDKLETRLTMAEASSRTLLEAVVAELTV